jgi:transmembrane 9 superfamily protein 2/4
MEIERVVDRHVVPWVKFIIIRIQSFELVSVTTILSPQLCVSIVFSVFFVLNLVFWWMGSSAAIPFVTLVGLLGLWFGISVPLTFVGAYFGFRKRVSSVQRAFNLFCYKLFYSSTFTYKLYKFAIVQAV